MIRIATLVLVLAAACGGKKSTPATTPGPGHDKDGIAGMHDEMANMPPEMAKFHDVLAPRWHADKGPQRMKDTCAALGDFHSDADALAKTAPPTGATADGWTASTKQLVDAVGGLDTTCQATDAGAFEAAFQKVHESFHGLMAATGMKHEGMEGMDHHEGGKHKM